MFQNKRCLDDRRGPSIQDFVFSVGRPLKTETRTFDIARIQNLAGQTEIQKGITSMDNFDIPAPKAARGPTLASETTEEGSASGDLLHLLLAIPGRYIKSNI